MSNDLRFLLAKEIEFPNPTSDLYDQIKVCCNKSLGSYVDIYLFKDSFLASDFARLNPEKDVFNLGNTSSKSKNSVPQIIWITANKSISLAPVGELKNLLTAAKEQFPLPDTALHYKIKIQCGKLMEAFLSKVQVVIQQEHLIS